MYNFKKGDNNEDRLYGYLHDENRPDRLQLVGRKIEVIPSVQWKDIRAHIIERSELFKDLSEQVEKPIDWTSFGYTEGDLN